MKLPIVEEIDYIHTDPKGLELDQISDCRWGDAAGSNHPMEMEFPLHLRREHYNHTSDIGHWHQDFLALYIVRGGRGTRRVNGQTHSLARGDVFLMAPDNTHSWRVPVDLTIDAIYFRQELWNEREWDGLYSMPDLAPFLAPGPTAFEARGKTDHLGHLSPELHTQVEATLAAIRRETKPRTLALHLAARARLYVLLVQLGQWRADKTFTTRPARGAAIAEILSFCDANFHRQLSTQQLAEMMHVSRANFFDIFNREVGMPPASYLRRLVETRYPVADIARLSGFQNATQLGRAFKKAFGFSPLDFRKKQKAAS